MKKLIVIRPGPINLKDQISDVGKKNLRELWKELNVKNLDSTMFLIGDDVFSNVFYWEILSDLIPDSKFHRKICPELGMKAFVPSTRDKPNYYKSLQKLMDQYETYREVLVVVTHYRQIAYLRLRYVREKGIKTPKPGEAWIIDIENGITDLIKPD